MGKCLIFFSMNRDDIVDVRRFIQVNKCSDMEKFRARYEGGWFTLVPNVTGAGTGICTALVSLKTVTEGSLQGVGSVNFCVWKRIQT